MQKKMLLIVNTKAGKTQSHGPLYDAIAVFSEAGYLVKVHNTSGPEDATNTVIQEGAHYDLVVCSGGDGTLNETITGLMRLEPKRRPLLGYLPRGTTNDFASSLHISPNPVKAALAITEHREQVLDIGVWNERKFVYVASFGAFTKSSYSVPQSAKNALGHFAYILEGMMDLNTLRPYKVKLSADGDVLDGEYLFGAICNSTSIGGLMKLDPEHVVLDDGKFEMLLIPNPPNPLALQNLIFALMNQHYDAEGLIFRHVSQVIVEPHPDEDLPWSLDGEYAPSTERVEITNQQGALTILL